MDPKSDGCRLCLDRFAESFTTIDNPELKVQMKKVFSFSIEPKQGYCSDVCQSCSYAISEFYQYSEKVRQNQEALNGNVTNCDSSVDLKIEFESVKVETLSDSELPQTTEDPCEPKDEVLEEEKVVEEEEVPNSGDDESYEPPPKKSQTKRRARSGKRKRDNLEADEPTKNSKRSRTNMKTLDPLISKHFRMICDLCGTSAATFTELCSHFKKEHKRNGYVVCCNKKVSKCSEILDHIDFHANPDAFRCDKCDKTFTCKESLSTHMTNLHSGKNRRMVCDTCGKEFLSKQCFNRHLKEHMGIDLQRVQCEICQRWLKNKDSLRNHISMVHKERKREFQCDTCLQKYPNSHALYLHKSRTHAEPKHECEFCGKKFKIAISLKEHRITHTGEALYACEYCGKPNTRKGGLHMHIKRRHPAEWAQMELKLNKKSDSS